jgi:acetyltransferase-like isoleucine patch superfamily enzyme
MQNLLRLLLYMTFRTVPAMWGSRLRARLWRLAGIRIHPTARVSGCVRFLHGAVEIGEGSYVGHESLISGPRVVIGSRCAISQRVTIHGGSHRIGGSECRAGPAFSEEIVIGNGVWIGTGAIILSGAHIGDGSVIAAGSVVTCDIPANTLAAGVPAAGKKMLP